MVYKQIFVFLAGIAFSSGIYAQESPKARAVVDLSSQTLTLYGKVRQTFPCVVGKRKHNGDSFTPQGVYQVTYKSESDGNLHGRFGAVYGRRFIGLRHTESGIEKYGIHGTNDEGKFESAQRYFSGGCVRLKNSDIETSVYPELQEGDRVLVTKEKK